MTYRILSLDGGGPGWPIQAMALADLYPGLAGRGILGEFDLVVAAGGGALVLGALMADRTPGRIIEALRPPAADVGAPRPRRGPLGWVLSRLGRGPLPSGKADVIATLLGEVANRALDQWVLDGPSELPVGVMMVLADRERGGARFLRGYAIEATGEAADSLPIINAVRAASGRSIRGDSDPGAPDDAASGFENPVMAGVIDALAMGAMPEDIEVLSIGAGQIRLAPPDLVAPGSPTPAALVRPPPTGAKAGEGRPRARREGPGDWASWAAHIALAGDPGEMGRVVRMNPLAQPARNGSGGWDYPKGLPAPLFDALVGLDRGAAGPGAVDLTAQWAEAWIRQGAPNQPIRAGADLSFALGDKTYIAAKRRWRNL